MLKGKVRDDLKDLWLFGDDPKKFEEKMLNGFSGFHNYGATYNASIKKFKIEIYDTEGNELLEEIALSENDAIEIQIEKLTFHALSKLENDYYSDENYGRHQWIFGRTIKCFLKVLDYSEIDYPYKNSYLKNFAEFTLKCIELYEDIFPAHPRITEIMDKINSLSKISITGYKLKKPYIYQSLFSFTSEIIKNGFIRSEDNISLYKFLHGEIPEKKIIWKKELRHFVYFINKLTGEIDGESQYLESPPSQKWKHLYSIFLDSEGKELGKKFYERYNRLGDKQQLKIDNIFNVFHNIQA